MIQKYLFMFHSTIFMYDILQYNIESWPQYSITFCWLCVLDPERKELSGAEDTFFLYYIFLEKYVPFVMLYLVA
jgi:hypothetical protein